jgi:type IV secretory pathway VirB6-like protein
VVILGVIYGTAKDVYENTHVCGAEWMKPNPSEYDFSANDYKQTVKLKVDGYIRDNNTGDDGLSFKNKYYREWFYDGKEYEDNPYQGEACRDPTQAKDKYGQYPKQKYYLKGTATGNYNCKKYLVLPGQSTPYNYDDMKSAYGCCVNRSQNFMCLDYTNELAAENPPATRKNTPTFCRKGENCTMMQPDYDSGLASAPVHNAQTQNGGIWFTINQADSNGSLLCAETYSLCPYNFYVGGGADECDYYKDGKYDETTGDWTMITQADIEEGNCEGSEIRNSDCTYNEKAGRCKNYCQYLVHCTKTSTENFIYQSSLGSPYFSQACLDFTGDSQNNEGFNTGIVMGQLNHFSAPIAQCMKETLENLFYNRAGHSKCLDYNESPGSDGSCASGSYVQDGNFIYKKGNKVKDNSLFQMIQKVMNVIIRLGLTFAVIFYGANLLLGKANLGDKKTSLVFMLKIALVMYFCLGTAWQDIFFRGFYDSSMSLAQILFKIETSQDPLKQDGCQFGKVTYSDGSAENVSIYPDGKSYLAIWDTIDCKMMRYLGFGPQISGANIASMVISSYFYGPIGIYFAMSVMIFGFFLISLAIRALHIFISSAMAIILLVFVSPLVIPCAMFEKTKNIFDGWLEKLISCCLQPMILFAYIAVFVTVMDQTLIGSATFHGSAPTKTMSCASACYDSNGDIVPYDGDQAPACDQEGQKMVNPLDDSVACLLNFQDFGKWKAFEVIGVSLPAIQNLFEENVKQRILTMLKGALVMFLLYTFMDEIPGIIEALVGGGLAQKGMADPILMLKKTIGVADDISKRLGRGASKAFKGAVRSADSAESYAKSPKERSPSRPESGGADEVGSSADGQDGDGADRSSSNQAGGDESGSSGGGGDESGGGDAPKGDESGK